MKAFGFLAMGIGSTLALSLSSPTASAQQRLSLVEGAACAQSSAFIEMLEGYNNSVHDEIGEKQVSQDRRVRGEANALLIHFNRMVELRQELIQQYETNCSRGAMSPGNMRSICSPQNNGISFADTVFCKPLKEAQ